jgi:hypothetical protein
VGEEAATVIESPAIILSGLKAEFYIAGTSISQFPSEGSSTVIASSDYAQPGKKHLSVNHLKTGSASMASS